MAYGTEAMIPAKVRVPSFRYENFNDETKHFPLGRGERYDRGAEGGHESPNGSLEAADGKVL